jgi:hypothetical protein
MANAFIPKGYDIPQSGGKFFRMEETNRLRILSKEPLFGWQYFDVDNKPHLFRFDEKPTASQLSDMKEDGRLMHVWIMLVYNTVLKETQLWTLPQATIMKELKNLSEDPDFGHPNEYDIKIDKDGTGMKTKYTIKSVVRPFNVGTPEDTEIILDEAREIEKRLDCVFTGGNPFDSSELPADDFDAEPPRKKTAHERLEEQAAKDLPNLADIPF